MTDTSPSPAEELARLEATIAEHRALIADNPDNLYPVFADSLMSLAVILAEGGNHAEAVAAAEEGAEHFRHLADADPGTFRVHLASALNNLSNRLGEVERDDEARRACDDSIGLAREALADPNPIQARFVLVSALMNQSGRSWRLGEPERAIGEMDAAVDAFRDGGEALNQFLGVMVDALHKNAMALAEANRWDEAIAIRRMTGKLFPGATPAPVNHLLALTLEHAAFAQSRAGQPGQALPLVEEAVDISRSLAEAEPEQYTLFLAQSLSNMASRQFEAGASPQALEAALEAIKLYQDAAHINAADTVVPLAMTLETFANILASLGHEEQARTVLSQRDDLLEIAKQVEGLDDHQHGDGCGCH